MTNSVVSELTIIYQPISALKPFPRNSRTHSKRQIRKIADSIRTFGFTNPVLIDRAYAIVAGHGRVAAAKLLGIDRVPTIRLDGLNPDQIRTYILADNRLAEEAGWDKATLAIELQHLITIENLDVTVTGFESSEIDLTIHPTSSKRRREAISGSTKSGQAVSKSGDVWVLGNHRVMCGTSPACESLEAIDLVIRTWQKYTGDRAIQATTGKSFDAVAVPPKVSGE